MKEEAGRFSVRQRLRDPSSQAVLALVGFYVLSLLDRAIADVRDGFTTTGVERAFPNSIVRWMSPA